jgi:outer membrane protein assembly factor BamB
MKRMAMTGCILASVLTFLAATMAFGSEASAQKVAAGIVQMPGVRAGLCIVLGEADGDLAVALGKTGKWTVQCLDTDADRVADARKAVAKVGLYGPVSIDSVPFAVLPLNEDTANVIVVADLKATVKAGLTLKEICRVLAPYGTAFLGNAGTPEDLRQDLTAAGAEKAEPIQIAGKPWLRLTKSLPKDMDDWPQFRHDGSLSAMSHDMRVGPVARIRWLQGARMGDESSPLHSSVASEGRVFYVRSAGRSARGGALTRLEVRDAFNGQELWQTQIATAPGDWQDVIARQGMVFARLEVGGPIVALDAATGKEVRRFAQAGRMTWHDGKLLVGDSPTQWTALDPMTGETGRVFAVERRGRPEVCLAEKHLYLVEGDAPEAGAAATSATSIVCFDFDSGKRLWAQPNVGNGTFYTCQQGLLLMRGDSPEDDPRLDKPLAAGVRKPLFTGFQAFSAETGDHLWYHPITVKKGQDYTAAFFMGEQIWTYGDVPIGKDDHYTTQDKVAIDPETKEPLVNIGYVSLDPKTGKQTGFDKGLWKDFGRCGPDYATPNYVLGMDQAVYDLGDAQMWWCYPVRGDCVTSYIPANGMMYTYGNTCACDPYLNGIAAVSNTAAGQPEAPKTPRLEKGPAFGKVKLAAPAEGDWPMYRADAMRRAATAAPGAADKPSLRWKREVGRQVSAPVVAGGRVYLAAVDEHDVVSLDADRGTVRWRFTAGGRVDSAPTVLGNAVVFGSCDGWVYCLRADDGKLAWRYRVAPEDRRIMVRGQLESVWPVNGSVMVRDGVVYAAAGRHGDADGGLFLSALDAATGALAWEKPIKGLPPIRSDSSYLSIMENRENKYGETSSYNDVMLSDDKSLYFGALTMDLASHEMVPQPASQMLYGGVGSFLYDNTAPISAMSVRYEWALVGMAGTPGWRSAKSGLAVLYGNVLALAPDGKRVYLVDNLQHNQYGRGQKPRIAAMDNSLPALADGEKPDGNKPKRREVWNIAYDDLTLRFKALAVGGERVYATCQPGGNVLGAQPADKGELAIYEAASGQEMGRVDLGSAPLFDGVAVTKGRTYVAMENGSVMAFE